MLDRIPDWGLWVLLLIITVLLSYLITIQIQTSCNRQIVPANYPATKDTIYIHDTVYYKPYIPAIEIPHPEHGRVILELNDTIIYLTAPDLIYLQLDSFQQFNEFLYQHFDGRHINRKGK